MLVAAELDWIVEAYAPRITAAFLQAFRGPVRGLAASSYETLYCSQSFQKGIVRQDQKKVQSLNDLTTLNGFNSLIRRSRCHETDNSSMFAGFLPVAIVW